MQLGLLYESTREQSNWCSADVHRYWAVQLQTSVRPESHPSKKRLNFSAFSTCRLLGTEVGCQVAPLTAVSSLELSRFGLRVPVFAVGIFFLALITCAAQDSVGSILEDIRRDKPVPVADAPDLSQSGSSGAGMSPWLFPDSSLRKLGQEVLFILV